MKFRIIYCLSLMFLSVSCSTKENMRTFLNKNTSKSAKLDLHLVDSTPITFEEELEKIRQGNISGSILNYIIYDSDNDYTSAV
ncbi:MAG: hypothetical protein R3B45_16610 [Bdellovibrionota bacterium]